MRRPNGLTGTILATWFLANRTRLDENGCLIWTGTIEKSGYGKFGVDGNNHPAHRWMKTILHGPPPSEELVADHVCRTRACVNPEHIRWVTRTQNALENSVGTGALNAQKPCCPRCGAEYAPTRGGNRYCKPCNQKHAIRSYYENREARKAYMRAYYLRKRAEKRAPA